MAPKRPHSDKRRELLPTVASTFAELGYRRTTTAELARRCGVRENVLYRVWPDKKAMFIAAIGHVYDVSAMVWGKLLAESDDPQSAAERLLRYESTHHGEFGYYRIVFAGLSEADDPEIRAALAEMYTRYQRFITERIKQHRDGRYESAAVPASLAAWAVIGLGTVASIARELQLGSDTQRHKLFQTVGGALLDGYE